MQEEIEPERKKSQLKEKRRRSAIFVESFTEDRTQCLAELEILTGT
jgi:hypothetical protein